MNIVTKILTGTIAFTLILIYSIQPVSAIAVGDDSAPQEIEKKNNQGNGGVIKPRTKNRRPVFEMPWINVRWIRSSIGRRINPGYYQGYTDFMGQLAANGGVDGNGGWVDFSKPETYIPNDELKNLYKLCASSDRDLSDIRPEVEWTEQQERCFDQQAQFQCKIQSDQALRLYAWLLSNFSYLNISFGEFLDQLGQQLVQCGSNGGQSCAIGVLTDWVVQIIIADPNRFYFATTAQELTECAQECVRSNLGPMCEYACVSNADNQSALPFPQSPLETIDSCWDRRYDCNNFQNTVNEIRDYYVSGECRGDSSNTPAQP